MTLTLDSYCFLNVTLSCSSVDVAVTQLRGASDYL